MNKDFKIETLVRKNIVTLTPYSSARSEFDDTTAKMIFLDANENPFENGVNRYPDPQQMGLKTLLVSQKRLLPENILLGNGSDEVLDLLFRAFCEPSVDQVITLPPTYGMYRVLAGINNIANMEVPLGADFEPDVDAILKVQNKKTKLLLLCSPNNPTGNSFSEEKIKMILNNFQGLVVIDEAYIDFSENTSWVDRLSEFPNLVITQTLSKAYGMAGIRLGICYASAEIIAILNKIKPPYNINELTQQRAIERLFNIDAVHKEVVQIIVERKKLFKELLKLDFVKEVLHSDANFLLARVDDASKRYAQLLANGVVVRNRSKLPQCDNTLRFTVGTPAENVQLIKILKTL
jgi:histidinol-phosphate aminotransferase